MNRLKKIALVCLMAVFSIGPTVIQTTSAQPGVTVPVQAFYDELAPYGQWVQNPYYGTVWIPGVGPDFQPYVSAGHWIVTEYGNTWVSDYAWGWAPFHYGRWIFDDQYGGWAWIPGSDWGPAWVSWRSGGGYYGWAPLGPGVNVNINIPAPYWTFVPQVYINSPQWYGYRAPRPRGVSIYQNTTIINNVYRYGNQAYAYGPYRGEIERVTRRPVQVYRIDQIDRPGRSVISGNSVGFYRPGGGRYDNRGNYGYNNAPNGRYDNNNYGSRGNGGYSEGRYGTNSPGNRGYDNGRQPGNAYPNGRDNNPNGGYSSNPNGGYNGNNRDYTNPGNPSTPGAGNPTNGRYDNGGSGRGNGGFGNGNRPDYGNRGSYNNPSMNQPSPQPTQPQTQPDRQYNGGMAGGQPQAQPGQSRGDGGFAPGGRGGFSQPNQRTEQPQMQPQPRAEQPQNGQSQPQGGGRESSPGGEQRGGRGPR